MPNFWAVVYQYIMQYGIICIYLQSKSKSKTLRTKSKFIMELSVHIHTVKRLPRKLFQYQGALVLVLLTAAWLNWVHEREKINFPFPFLSSRQHFTPSAFFLSLSHFPFLFLTLWTSALSIFISTSLPHHSIRKKFKLRNRATVVLSPKAFFVPFLPDLFSSFLWMTEQPGITQSENRCRETVCWVIEQTGGERESL